MCRARTNTIALALMGALVFLAISCSPEPGSAGTGIATNTPPAELTSSITPEATPDRPTYSADPAVNGLFAAMTAWSPQVETAADTRELRVGRFSEGSYDYQCTVEPGELTRRFDEFPAAAFQGTLVPGLFIDGDDLLAGKIQALPLDRAPMELVISLASGNPVIQVAKPTTATLQQAVSSLQRDADSRVSGIDVVPADIDYVRKEAHSFEQTALELGFSLRYEGPLVQAGLDTAFDSQTSFQEHTILVRMVQPMYTISFVDDTVFEPRQLLGSSVDAEQVNAVMAAGRLQDDRPAVYIKSVTYGRTMLFTMTSSQVDQSSDLMAAMNAAYGSWSGSASISEQHREILANTEIRMVAIGGDTASAEAAIKSADPADYFNGVNTANAAPLTFRVATLTGEQAAIEDAITYQQQDCTRSVAPKPTYAFRFVLSQVEGWANIALGNSIKAETDGDGWNHGRTEYTFQGGNVPGGNQTVNVNFGRALCIDSKVNVKVYVNGAIADEQFFNGCAFAGVFEWTINKDTGKLTYRD